MPDTTRIPWNRTQRSSFSIMRLCCIWMVLIQACFMKPSLCNDCVASIPTVLNTWAFTNATAKAWLTVNTHGASALDAVEAGCSVCEEERCDGTVGYGGSPDEHGETTLDAMVMDGTTMGVGAVAGLRRVKSAVSVARSVLEHTKHSLLVGDQATQFAIEMGFREESLETTESHAIWQQWREDRCQPNFWQNVWPDPTQQCGPYSRNLGNDIPIQAAARNSLFGEKNHDTIGMVVLDSCGHIAAGTSTNGARHKIPGRVGDSPLPGAGAYADSEVGGAAATGDGDVMLRFLPSFVAVDEMRQGASPSAAATTAVQRIVRRHPSFVGAVVALDRTGHTGAACHGLTHPFQYSVAQGPTGVAVHSVSCL